MKGLKYLFNGMSTKQKQNEEIQMIAILIRIYLDPSFQAVRGFFALPFKSATVGVASYLINNKIIGF